MRRLQLTILLLVLLPSGVRAQVGPVADPDPERFRAEIAAFREADRKTSPPSDPVLFVGSSSIRFWQSASAFPGVSILNRGFGGSHISDVLAFFDDVVAPYPATAIVFYCGDNDINDGKPPSQVLADFGRFRERVQDTLGGIPLIWVPIKPSPSRWEMWETMKQVNEAVQAMSLADPLLYVADTATPMLQPTGPPSADLFVSDLLHLNAAGYALWNSVTAPVLEQALRKSRERREQELRGEIARYMDALATDLKRDGPAAWMRHFPDEASFFMGSDGTVVFPDPAAARAMVDTLEKTYSSIDIEWVDLRIELLSPDLAAVVTPYRETLVSAGAASDTSFGGLLTATLRRGPTGWHIANLHWSSPVQH